MLGDGCDAELSDRVAALSAAGGGRALGSSGAGNVEHATAANTTTVAPAMTLARPSILVFAFLRLTMVISPLRFRR
jgi:hypothetical protein